MAKFCSHCGKEIHDDAVICVHCGCSVGGGVANAIDPTDSGSIGWGVLGFFFPLIGLILYLVWKDTKPKSASVAGKGALISVIIRVVLGIVYGIIFGVMMADLY